VSFNSDVLLQRLAELEKLAPPPARYVIALSGGLDSTVLAHALSTSRQQHGKSLAAVHVDHQLHPDSATWAKHCETVAKEFGIEFLTDLVHVDVDAGKGPEAAARNARYTALRQHVETSDWLLSAHHQDDQAETLLLNLLRGSGPSGVAAMRSIREFGDGWLARPLLEVSRDELATYAADEALNWIEDPSNHEREFDRNFLRADVLPLLQTRWPHARAKLARSATLARDAASLLADLADLDIASMDAASNRLPVPGLRALSPSRQRNLLRRAIQEADLPAPAASHLQEILEQLLPAREDAEPLVNWPGAEARRYRDTLYLLPAAAVASFESGQELGGKGVRIGPGLGELVLVSGAGQGLSEAAVAAGLSVRLRRGGEEIKLVGQSHTRKLKKLLQEEGVVPWLRDQLPLVFSGDHLVAVADLWIADSAAAENGLQIRWLGRPQLY
jgi:tRNA(Ile)-lysidine synthase